MQRQDPKALPLARKMILEARLPQGKLHAAAVYASMPRPNYATIESLLRDRDAEVRRGGLRLCATLNLGLADPLIEALARDDSPLVRYELAWALSAIQSEEEPAALRNIVTRGFTDKWVRLAVTVTATGNEASDGTLDFISDRELRKTPEGRAFIESLVETAGATKSRYMAIAALRGISRLRDEDAGFQFHLLSVLGSRASEETLRFLRKDTTAVKLFEQLHERAIELAFDGKANDDDRARAIRSLSFMAFENLNDLFTMALKPNQPRTVQVAAFELLGRLGAEETPALILKAWPSLSPQVRATATEIFLSRNNWVQLFLDAVEEKKIARGDIDPARVALLMKSPNRSVRLRVQDLFKGAALSQRKDVVNQYQKSLTLKGDPVKGKLIFKKDCSACHKLEDVGNEVGADLKALRDRGTENMLLNILDPNREVKPQYLAYTLDTTNGKSFSGMIAAETPNSVTIRLLDGRTETVQRGDIDTLRSTGLSFMPEGMEKQIDVQAMADLLAYLNSIK